MDLAPEFPVLDGDSGKTAGVAVRFLSLRSRPLESIAQLEICQRPLRWARPLFFIAALRTDGEHSMG
jgi:hypothetical protein